MEPLSITTSRFLTALFPHLEAGECIELRAKLDSGIMDQKFFSTPVDLVEYAKSLMKTADLWYGPGVRSRQSGTDADVSVIHALWADVDAKCFATGEIEEAWQLVTSLQYPPSIIINSGHGLQCYWVLDTPAKDNDLTKAVDTMRGIAALLSVQLPRRLDSVHNPSRILRLPNSYNHKDNPPVPTSVIFFEPSKTYSLEDLTVWVPPTVSESSSFSGYSAADFTVDTTLDINNLITVARSNGMAGWVSDALYRPDLHHHDDDSALDWAVAQELVKFFTPGQVEYIWLNTTLGQRSKVRDRQDYRRGTIWKAHQIYKRSTTGSTTASSSTRTSLTNRKYIYTPANGLELIGRRSNTLLARFDIRLIRATEVVTDDPESIREYDVQFFLNDDDNFIVRLRQRDMESDQALRKRLVAILPPHYYYYAGFWNNFLPALFELSSDRLFETDRSPGMMGWVNGKEAPKFVLPAAAGAITASGVDFTYHFSETARQALPERLRTFGEGVKPIKTAEEYEQATKAFLALMECSAAETILPIATHVLAGPLANHGLQVSPPLLHIMGRTGTMKTTLATLCLALFGSYSESAPESWISTQNALARRLYEARDMTLLIDDYKRGKAEPVALIQNYADRTTRNRLTAEADNRSSYVPRGLLLSTGEDVWEEHESMEARTITIQTHRPPDEDVVIWLERLTRAQQLARGGGLTLVGGEWLSWLAAKGLDSIESLLLIERESIRSELTIAAPSMHKRLLATLSSLLCVERVVSRFLEERLPACAGVYREKWQIAKQELLGLTGERSEESSQLAPYPWTLGVLAQGFLLGQICLAHRSTNIPQRLGMQTGERIGFYDDDYIYLTREATYHWIKERARRASDSLHFTWPALCQGVRDALGPMLIDGKDRRVSYQIRYGNSNPVRCIILPRSLFSEVGIELDLHRAFDTLSGTTHEYSDKE